MPSLTELAMTMFPEVMLSCPFTFAACWTRPVTVSVPCTSRSLLHIKAAFLSLSVPSQSWFSVPSASLRMMPSSQVKSMALPVGLVRLTPFNTMVGVAVLSISKRPGSAVPDRQ